MADLTLNEYKYFSETKIKEIILEDRIKLCGRDSKEIKIPAGKISLFRKFLVKLSGIRLIRIWIN